MKKNEFRKYVRTAILLLLAIISGGCAQPNYLTLRTSPDRARLGDKEIPVPPPPPVEIVNPNPAGPGEPIVLPIEVTGTWTFTAPPTVTQVEKRLGDTDQFSIYNGRPAPTDTPFIVITVARGQKSLAAADPANYKISSDRTYTMNGNIVEEWTGRTAAGSGFSELLIHQPGTQSQDAETCHAMAVVRTPEEQKLAVAILGSIVYQASR